MQVYFVSYLLSQLIFELYEKITICIVAYFDYSCLFCTRFAEPGAIPGLQDWDPLYPSS